MTIQVKLFSEKIVDNYESNLASVAKMESNMNDFLQTIKDDDLEKIYVALGPTQRMGLIAYRIEDENSQKTKNTKVIDLEVDGQTIGVEVTH